MLHNSRPIGAVLIILGLLSIFMDILPVSRVLVASSSLEMTWDNVGQLIRRLIDFL